VRCRSSKRAETQRRSAAESDAKMAKSNQEIFVRIDYLMTYSAVFMTDEELERIK
jgi:hypothetical protein